MKKSVLILFAAILAASFVSANAEFRTVLKTDETEVGHYYTQLLGFDSTKEIAQAMGYPNAYAYGFVEDIERTNLIETTNYFVEFDNRVRGHTFIVVPHPYLYAQR